MKAVACLLILAGVVSAQRGPAPQPYSNLNEIPIISFINENNYDGSYRYSYETGNGISVQEDGVLTNPGTEQEAQTAKGSYSYTTPDGQLIQVTWYADETGFHAEGAHLPKVPSPAVTYQGPPRPPIPQPSRPPARVPPIGQPGYARPRGK